MEKNLIQVKILRYNPLIDIDKKSHYQLYKIPCSKEKMTIMEVFDYINKYIESSFSYRKYNCNRGTCHSCLVKLDGHNVRACSASIEVGKIAIIEPFNKKIIKDMVVDFNR